MCASSKRLPVSLKRDIQYGDAAGGSICEPGKERDVSLDTGDESCFRLRLMQAELLQCADAIRIAIEHIDAIHGSTKAEKEADDLFLKTRNIKTIPDIGETKGER